MVLEKVVVLKLSMAELLLTEVGEVGSSGPSASLGHHLSLLLPGSGTVCMLALPHLALIL